MISATRKKRKAEGISWDLPHWAPVPLGWVLHYSWRDREAEHKHSSCLRFSPLICLDAPPSKITFELRTRGGSKNHRGRSGNFLPSNSQRWGICSEVGSAEDDARDIKGDKMKRWNTGVCTLLFWAHREAVWGTDSAHRGVCPSGLRIIHVYEIWITESCCDSPSEWRTRERLTSSRWSPDMSGNGTAATSEFHMY